MERSELILATMSQADGGAFRPVQIQKLFFMMDREIPKEIEGPHFSFRPYDYGPFDSDVYLELDALEMLGLVQIDQEWNWRVYSLTKEGQEKADELFEKLSDKAKAYINETVEFVRTLSFTQLVRAIYKAYPEMRKNSVFQESS